MAQPSLSGRMIYSSPRHVNASFLPDLWPAVYHRIQTLSTPYSTPSLAFVSQHLSYISFAALLYAIAINASVIYGYSRFTAPNYFGWQMNFTRRRFNRTVLWIHIIGSLTEIIRWHVRALYQDLPQADVLDVVLCIIQIATNLALTKNTGRGYPTMTSQCLLN